MPFFPVRGDITKMRVDAIVNAANCSLLGGGGVDGAIHRAAGPELVAECRTLNGCETGDAKMTRGYRLPARYVIHTVGPVYFDGRHGEEALLRRCFRRSLELAAENQLESVAFPLISAGAYGYPREDAVRVASEEITAFLMNSDMTVYLVFFDLDPGDFSEYYDLKERIESSRSSAPVFFEPCMSIPHEDIMPEACIDADVYFPEADFDAAVSMLREDAEQTPEADIDAAGSLFSTCPETEESASAEDIPESICPKAEFSRSAFAKGFPARESRRPAPAPVGRRSKEIDDALRNRDESFARMLFRCIDAKGMKDPDCYRKANIDKKLFSKIRSKGDNYRPTKSTALAFAVALEFDLAQTDALLRSAGLALNGRDTFDIIVRHYISRGEYDIWKINNMLFLYDQPLLGNYVTL